jgi:hypothetical protein
MMRRGMGSQVERRDVWFLSACMLIGGGDADSSLENDGVLRMSIPSFVVIVAFLNSIE